MRPLEKLFVWIALVAYCVSGAFAVEGVQLCLEADGHVSLEVVAEGCSDCCEPSEEGAHVESCPCVDISLATPVVSFVKTRSDLEGSAVGLPSGGWREVMRPIRGHDSFQTHRHFRASSPAELVRNVVLRV